jgi:hypothetical protein
MLGLAEGNDDFTLDPGDPCLLINDAAVHDYPQSILPELHHQVISRKCFGKINSTIDMSRAQNEARYCGYRNANYQRYGNKKLFLLWKIYLVVEKHTTYFAFVSFNIFFPAAKYNPPLRFSIKITDPLIITITDVIM